MTDNQRAYFYHQVKKFFVKCSEQVIHGLSFDNATEKNCISWSEKEGINAFRNNGKKMPNIWYYVAQWSNAISCWKSVHTKYLTLDVLPRLMTWNKMILLVIRIFMSFGQFPIMKRLVQACLIVPHGNSDVERIFSMLNDILTKKRLSLDQQNVKALTFIKSYMTSSNLMCHEVLRDCVVFRVAWFCVERTCELSREIEERSGIEGKGK